MTPDPMPTGLGATSDPLAACVAALQSARCERYYEDDGCDGPDGCDACQRLMVAEMGPLLLDGIENDLVAALTIRSDLGEPGVAASIVRSHFTAALARLLAAPVGPATTEGDGR